MNNTKLFALITGGSSGIGWAIAQQLAARQYNLVLVSNQTEQLQVCKALAEEIYKVRCHTLNADLTFSSSAQLVFDFCQTNQLDIEVLVNNAGMLVFSEVVEAPLEKINAILQLHMYTPVMLCHLFGAQMKKKRAGYVMNISSISAVMAYPGISLYGPTKTFMRSFTKAFRSEMLLYHVNVSCVLPGATATALYDPNRVNIDLAKKLGVMHEAEFVAKKSIDALFSNRAECIPGFMNKLTVWLLPYIPQFIILLIHRHTTLVKRGNESLG